MRRKHKWSSDDTIELLAHLDFVVEKLHQNSGRVLKADILRMLQHRLTKRHNHRQIESKLFNLWSGSRNEHSKKTFEDVWVLGSRCMKNLDSGLKLRVRENLDVIKINELYIHSSTPRQLRSASRNPGTESNRSKRDQSIPGDRCTPTKSTRTKQRRTPLYRASRPAEDEIPSLKVCETYTRLEQAY